MFGISFSELIVVFIIAFLVLGPEKLQEFAKSLGKFISSINNFSSNIKDEISSSITSIDINDTKSTNEFKGDDVKNVNENASEDNVKDDDKDDTKDNIENIENNNDEFKNYF